MKPGKGVVAVDPRFIPLGTRLYIENYGYAIAGDTGGAIKGNRIDLAFNSHHEAEAIGRRNVRVMILP
jgi:3D (Asp-Asp-Asp) domain-containing protein